MIAVDRGARSACLLIGLVGALLVSIVGSASAAPTWNATLTNDASDVQAVYVEATAGEFRLTFAPAGAPTGPGISETADIPATATATQVRDALNALSNIGEPGGAPGGSVSVQIGGGDANGVNPYLVSFDGGPLKAQLQPLMTASNGTEPLSASPLGGGPAIAYVATRVPGGVTRGDERINYSIETENTAAPVIGNPTAGTTLGCNGARPSKAWSPGSAANRPSAFEFEWRRNGAVIPGEEGSAYVATSADEGTVIQCLVKGTSANKNSAAKYASLPGAVVDPQPGTAPPAATTPTNNTARPTITGTSPRTCTAPTGFTGTPTWTFQWLRNGEKIAGANTNATATTSQYTTGAEDEGTRLQCEAIATNAGGSLVSVSEGVSIGSVTQPAALSAANTPSIVLDGSSPVIELDLPAGTQSHLVGLATSTVAASNYWSCSELPPAGLNPAKVVCTNPNILAPQTNLMTGGTNSVGNLTLGVSLGADIPDLASLEARVSGDGAATVALPDTFAIGPKRPFGLIPGRFSARALGADGEDFTQAGGHPAIANSSLSINRDRRLVELDVAQNKHRPVANVRSVSADIPPGFVGNPQAVPDLCPKTQDMLTEPSSCPPSSLVGEVAIQFAGSGQDNFGLNYKRMALWAMIPEKGAPAQFAAVETFNKGVYVLTPQLRPEDNYAIGIDAVGVPELPPILDVRVTLCGYGANSKQSGPVTLFGSCKQKGDAGAYTKPFLTSQTECASAGPVTTVRVDSWKEPSVFKTAEAVAPKMTGCELVPFEPKLDLQPTTNQAESASGLNVELTVPTDGFEDPDGLAQAHLKKTTVTLPAGMSVNPSAADGLAACTQAQLGMVNGVPNNDPVQCPDASKVGTAVAKTPILEEPLEGSVYLAKQGDNPFGTLVAIYVVVESKERGVLIKLPGRVDIRPNGQIVSTFDDNPQAPVSSLELSFDSGPRAALMTPQRCGTYDIVSQLTPWSAADPDNPTAAETVTQVSSFQVTSGPGGGPCPTGALLPKAKAGLTNPLAGSSSPFVLNLSRDDGTQRFNGLNLTLPPGLAASLRGVPYCPDGVLASIPTAEGTGAAEIANPSCPAASRIGSVSVGAGAGNPYYVNTGSAYLAGPYKGAPLSIAVVVPAVAGPFDLGNVVVRNAAHVNPVTAQVSVQSDPLPTQLHNLPVDVRDVRIAIDRPGFMRAPTSCEEMRIDGVVGGEEGGLVPISNRFQVNECAALDFGPKLKLKYKGATKRSGNPGLRAVLTQPGGQANISNTVVVLPRGSFIDNAHINNPCTRDEYAAGACPKSSIVGYAKAWSPLLDEPLQGPVYFRANGGARQLPDIVASLHGQVHVELVGFIDAIENKRSGSSRVRNTFAIVPDAPVSRFVLNMKGGKRGLIENSRNLCKGKNKATVKMKAHNGLVQKTTPNVQTDCGKKKNNKGKKRVKR